MTSQPNLFETSAETPASTSSPAVRRARPHQVQESVWDLVTSVFYGENGRESFASLDPDGSWRKMSVDSSPSEQESLFPRKSRKRKVSRGPRLNSGIFYETWPTWGIAWDGHASALTKPLERPNAATGSSSSGSWPSHTAWSCAQTAANPSAAQTGGTTLPGAAQTWPTADGAPEAPNTGSNSRNVTPGLGNRATEWPAAAARDYKGDSLESRQGGDALPDATNNWPEADSARSPRAQPTSTDGQESLNAILAFFQRYPGKRRLNWRFVVWLMGFPEDWLG